MRKVVSDAATIVSTIPGDVVERAARKRGMTVEEFIAHYDVEFLYDGIEGGFFSFVEKLEKSKKP